MRSQHSPAPESAGSPSPRPSRSTKKGHRHARRHHHPHRRRSLHGLRPRGPDRPRRTCDRASRPDGDVPLRTLVEQAVLRRHARHDRLRRHARQLMTSQAIRDPLADHLITPQNSTFVLIDYQPEQLATVRSMDHDLLMKNVVSTVRAVKTFGVPVVHSTVNVAGGQVGPTLPELAALLKDDAPIDRTTVNSWEDIEFLEA